MQIEALENYYFKFVQKYASSPKYYIMHVFYF